MIGLRTVSFFTLASLACSSHAAPCGEHLPRFMFSTLDIATLAFSVFPAASGARHSAGYQRLTYLLHVILSRLPRGGGRRSLYFFQRLLNYKFEYKTVRVPRRRAYIRRTVLHQLSRRFNPWAPAPQKTPSRRRRATTRRERRRGVGRRRLAVNARIFTHSSQGPRRTTGSRVGRDNA